MRALHGHHILRLRSRGPCRGVLGACMIEMQPAARQASTMDGCVTKNFVRALLWLVDGILTQVCRGSDCRQPPDNKGVCAA